MLPAPFVLARREPTRISDAIRDGRGLEDDDHPLPDRDARPLRASETLPARVLRRRGPGALPSAGRDQDAPAVDSVHAFPSLN